MRARIARDTVRGDGSGGPDHGPVEPEGSLAAQWRALHEQAARVARIAQLSPEPFAGALLGFPAAIGGAHKWQRELARQGLEDIDAMMRPGLAALETMRRRGQAAHAPALALWREFYTARGAVMELAGIPA